MSEDFFSVLKTFGHFSVFAVQSGGERVLAFLSFEVDVGNEFLFTGEDDLRLVSEVYLDNFVAKPKHDGMFSFHPLFDIHIPSREVTSVRIHPVFIVQVVSEML